MINFKKKQEVLLMYLRQGRSQREIAKMVGIDRKTVNIYIKEYESQRSELIKQDVSMDAGELIQTIVEAPRYHVGARPKHSLTKEMEEKFQELVLENKEKRRNGLRKQQKKPKEAYIKGSFLPGDICEFDWGEVKITINGKR